MDKALHITSLKNITYLTGHTYQYLYWGHEFCQNLIPTVSDTKKAIACAAKHGARFVFVTSFVTEKKLGILVKFFEWFLKINLACEIVVNDWGVLGYLSNLRAKNFTIALGRLLVHQQTDPGLARSLCSQQPMQMVNRDGKYTRISCAPLDSRFLQGMRSTYADSSFAQQFLLRYGVKRIELNNPGQGLLLRKNSRLKKSVYTPFVHIATTRFCPMEFKYQKIKRLGVCHQECRRYYDVLNDGVSEILYKRGNSVFYKNPCDESSLDPAIDRIVFQPELL